MAAAIAISSTMAAPLIDPTSGLYRPPLVVAISPASATGGVADLEDRTAHICYTVQRAVNAADVSGATAAGSEPPPTRYAGAFTIADVGRVKVKAFVRRIGGHGEVHDGPASTALFLLDRGAPPPNRLGSGVLLHSTREPAPAVNASTLKAAMSNASLDTNQVVASNKRFLQFVELPAVVRSFETFSLNLFLVDGCGFPIALPEANPTVCLTAEVTDATGRPIAAAGPPAATSSVVRVPCAASATDNTPTPVAWAASANVLSCGKGSLHRIGDSSAWDAWATCRPVVSLKGPHVGVEFTVDNPCRAIVGIHYATIDPTARSSWRNFNHSMHFSADTTDASNALPFYRLYEDGTMVEDVGTKGFEPGATFAIKLRPNGAIVYSVNGCVIHVSPQRYDATSQPLALTVKLASQSGEPALGRVGLLRSETPSLVTVSGLLWRASPQVESADDGELRRDREARAARDALNNGGDGQLPANRRLVFRGWIEGSEHVPASAVVAYDERPMPRWAVGAVSLAAMFALGGLGCQSSQVSRRMLQPRPAGLTVVPDVNAGPSGMVGRWLSPEAALRAPVERKRLAEEHAAAAATGRHQGLHPLSRSPAASGGGVDYTSSVHTPSQHTDQHYHHDHHPTYRHEPHADTVDSMSISGRPLSDARARRGHHDGGAGGGPSSLPPHVRHGPPPGIETDVYASGGREVGSPPLHSLRDVLRQRGY